MFSRKTPPPHHGHVTLSGTRVPYTVTRTPTRRRSIGYRVVPGEGVLFRAPIRASIATCEGIMVEKQRWILKHFTKPKPPAKLAFTEGTTIPYLDETLTIARTTAAKPKATHKGATLTLAAPTQAQATTLAKTWFRKQAAKHFEDRVPHWAKTMNLKHGPIRITDAKSRWGSCSHTNTLRFNWRLMLTPPALLDYVIVHELAHIPHKNHGPKFWALVEEYMPDYKLRRKELTQLGRIIP